MTMLIYAVFKSCEPESVLLPKSKQKQFQVQIQVHKSYKTRKSTLSCIGNYEENIDLSLIHLTVLRIDFVTPYRPLIKFMLIFGLKYNYVILFDPSKKNSIIKLMLLPARLPTTFKQAPKTF